MNTTGSTALTHVYLQHRNALLSYARGRGCAPQDAEDVVQDVFTTLLRVNRFAELAALPSADQYAMLCCRVRSLVQNRWRDRHRHRRDESQTVALVDVEHLVLSIHAHGTPAQALDRAWALDTLDQALDRLRSEHRIGTLPGLEDALRGDQPSDQAEAQGVHSTSRFRVALHRARKRLRALVCPAEIHAALCAA
jgi:DNA-directed RNA polymerase specialized sigma24 family protein